MWLRIKEILCCSDSTNTVTPVRGNRVRLSSKYAIQQVNAVPDEIRRAGGQCYSCPICFLYFDSKTLNQVGILACSNCHNFICVNCLQKVIDKADKENIQMACSFCQSKECQFVDWNSKEKKQYFDMSALAFPKVEKEKEAEIENEKSNKQEQQNGEVFAPDGDIGADCGGPD